MLTGINIYETRNYKSKLDPDTQNPTIFKIGVLDQQIKDWIEDQATSYEISSPNPNEPAKATLSYNRRNTLAVKFGLKGLENFIDPKTKQPVKFDTINLSKFGKNYQVVTDEIISMFPRELIRELAGVILNENTLSGEEIKK